MKQPIRIASGQGFWGDLLTAPRVQVTKGPVDYLVMDYLAEVTMSIMQKQKRRNPALGYAKDMVPLIEDILPDCLERKVKIITNGGGVNPHACAEAILNSARKIGIKKMTIGIVSGDDILAHIDELRSRGIAFRNMETGDDVSTIADRLSSANVYFGAFPIVEALRKGADVVITGRTTDTGLTLAPMIYEYNWKEDDWDKLAAGTIAGHIMECGGQATGGNFSADWKRVHGLENIGFPITEAYPDGGIVITKHKGTGGLVSRQTVKEQLLYEIGNPKNYITPEVIADFTTIQLSDDGPDRVKMTGVRGRPCTDTYKVSMSYADGYTAVSTLTYTWPDALEKAKAADRILRERLKNLDLEFEEIRTEFVGINACHDHLASIPDPINEVVLRIGVRGKDYESVERFGKEIAPLILTGPPSVTGFAGGRPKPGEVITFWPALIPKNVVEPSITIEQL
jgi:hypothetical protein